MSHQKRRPAVSQPMTLERGQARGVTRERHQVYDIALSAQPRPKDIGQRVGLDRISGRATNARTLIDVDSHDASGDPALLVYPFTDFLRAEFGFAEPCGLLGYAECEHRRAVAQWLRALPPDRA